jgi:hypothetical protein
MVNTVAENREGFTQREYDDAKAARRGLVMVGYPSPKDFKNMVRSNMIKNCPNTPANISAANKIFGPDVASLLIPQVRPAHKYPNSPWEMMHPPGGDNTVCM